MAKKLYLAVLLMVLLVACKSGKRLHLVADNPYVDPRTAAVRHDPFQERTSWWDILFPKDKKKEEPVQLKMEGLEGNDGSTLSSDYR